VLKQQHPSPGCEFHFSNTVFIIIIIGIYLFPMMYTNNTGEFIYMIIRIYVHSSFCVLNCILTDAEQILRKLPAPHTRLSTPAVREGLHNLAEKMPSDYVL
jgi:hypothetical protein